MTPRETPKAASDSCPNHVGEGPVAPPQEALSAGSARTRESVVFPARSEAQPRATPQESVQLAAVPEAGLRDPRHLLVSKVRVSPTRIGDLVAAWGRGTLQLRPETAAGWQDCRGMARGCASPGAGSAEDSGWQGQRALRAFRAQLQRSSASSFGERW